MDLHLPKTCDGCTHQFTLQHALGCKKGGLVIFRHNEIRDELGYLASLAFTPSKVQDEPLINTSPAPAFFGEHEDNLQDRRDSPTLGTDADERGDLLIQGLWTRTNACMVDVRVTDTDAKSYRTKDPKKVLATQEREKKKKYLEKCLQQRRHFTPFVISTDGLLGYEAAYLLKRIAYALSLKWRRPYAHTCGWVKSRISIATVRATHRCLRGSRIPAELISVRRPQWEDGAGLGLTRF